LAQDRVSLLSRLQQGGAVASVGGVERLRRVEDGADRGRVEQPAGLEGERAARGQGLQVGVVVLLAVEVVCAQVDVELHVSEERRRVLQSLPQLRQQHERLRSGGGHERALDRRRHLLDRRRGWLLLLDLLLGPAGRRRAQQRQRQHGAGDRDRKSTRLNSSHQIISYAVFCLKK